MHFVWQEDFENESSYAKVHISNVGELSGVKPTLGKPLGKLPPILLEAVSGDPLSDFIYVGPFFIVSERLRRLLDDLNVAAEYHEVEFVKCKMKKVCYYFANLLEKANCLDFDKSIYTMRGQFVDEIEKLAIDETKVVGKNLVRLDKSLPVVILASRELKDKVENSGISGVFFQKPSEWKF
jgi:hypothetical protein